MLYPGSVLLAALRMQTPKRGIGRERLARDQRFFGQGLAEKCQMMKEDALECLAVLTASAEMIAELLKDAVATETGPGTGLFGLDS